jgi:hypothetical protein
MSEAPIIPNRGRAESARLTKALVDLAARGLRTHCSDAGTGGLWLSDHPGERREAAKLCRHCPVIVECNSSRRPRRTLARLGRPRLHPPLTAKKRERKPRLLCRAFSGPAGAAPELEHARDFAGPDAVRGACSVVPRHAR